MVITQDAISSYKNQLNNRFYSNSMALEVLICLVMVFILVIQIVKYVKKTYQWQIDYQLRIQQRHTEQSRSILRQRSQLQAVVNENPLSQKKKQEEQPKSRGERSKKQAYVPPVIVIQEVIKNKLPQIAIIAINVIMIASYEYCAIVSYISIVIIVIAELIGSQHVKLKLGLDLISKVLLISLYVNVFTVAKPSRP